MAGDVGNIVGILTAADHFHAQKGLLASTCSRKPVKRCRHVGVQPAKRYAIGSGAQVQTFTMSIAHGPLHAR
ncbi:MAG: hypothetical protein JO082_02780 [Mycobacterium sp.]|nr:hypothetical protein [Mycobacterium sp.]